jgi:AIR synthase-related protein
MLDALADTLLKSRGLTLKRDIAPVIARLDLGVADAVHVGDDCAAIPDGDGYLLLAIEGFMNEFVAALPWFAGYCGVMVNVSDIYAMGGRPVAIVDALWSDGEDQAGPVLGGLKAGATTYGVPIVGGHSNMRSAQGQLAVAILGRARRLLTSFDARPGDVLMAAIDLRGGYHEPHPFFDASTRGAPAERLRADLDIMASLAEDGLCCAAKDVSNGGVIGTAMMLLESSGVGGVIDVTAVPRPEGVALGRWLETFPSYGFLLSVSPAALAPVLDRFMTRGIAAAAIGRVDDSRTLRLSDGTRESAFWDFAAASFIGCRAL